MAETRGRTRTRRAAKRPKGARLQSKLKKGDRGGVNHPMSQFGGFGGF